MNFYLIITIISTLFLCVFSVFSILVLVISISNKNKYSTSDEVKNESFKIALIILGGCIINVVTLWILYNGVKL